MGAGQNVAVEYRVATSTPGTAAHGSGSHVSGVYLQSITGTRFQFVPYRGAGPAMQDLVAGQIDIMIDQAANSLPQVRAGTIKAYAVTDKTRLAAAPDIPTVDQAGVPGLHISIWHALWMPKGTPKDIIAKLNAAVVDALADARARQRLADLGREFLRASSRIRRRLPLTTRPRLKSGGQSSKRRAFRKIGILVTAGARGLDVPATVLCARRRGDRVTGAMSLIGRFCCRSRRWERQVAPGAELDPCCRSLRWKRWH